MLWHVKSNMTEIGLTMSETMRSSQVGIEYLLEYRVIAEHISDYPLNCTVKKHLNVPETLL